MAEAQAPFEPLEEDRGLQEGDLAVIDFEGFLNDGPFAGGKAEKFELRIGSGQFVPGFEEQLIDMKKGEKRTIEVTFPEKYGSEKLAGKTTTFEVTLHEIKVKKPAEIDDALAQKVLGDETATLDTLRAKVYEELKSEKLSKLYTDELKPKLVERMVEYFEIDLPETVVEQEIEMSLRNKIAQMSEEEIEKLRNDEEEVKKQREALREEAEKSVKATFLVDAIAKKEGVEVTDQEMMQAIYYEALMAGREPQQIFEYYQKQNLLPAIKMAMVEDRLLSKLLDAKRAPEKASDDAAEEEA